MNRKLSKLIIVLGALLSFVGYCSIFLQHYTFGHDSVYWFVPVFTLLFDGIKSGVIPVINVFDNAGMPLAQTYVQNGIFQLPNVLSAAFGTLFSGDAITVAGTARLCKIIIGLAGAFLLLSRYTDSITGWIVAAAICFGTSMAFNPMVQPGVMDMFYTIPFLIFILLFWENKKSLYFLLLTLLILSQGILSYFVFSVVSVYLLFIIHTRSFNFSKACINCFGSVKNTFIIGFFSLIFIASQFLLASGDHIISPLRLLTIGWENMVPAGAPHFAPIGEKDLSTNSSFLAYSAIKLTGTFISPRQLLLMPTNFILGYGETSLFVGPALVLLFFVGLVRGFAEPSPNNGFWLLLLVFSCVVILGANTHFYHLVYLIFPPSWVLRHTELYQNLFMLSFGYFAVRGVSFKFVSERLKFNEFMSAGESTRIRTLFITTAFVSFCLWLYLAQLPSRYTALLGVTSLFVFLPQEKFLGTLKLRLVKIFPKRVFSYPYGNNWLSLIGNLQLCAALTISCLVLSFPNRLNTTIAINFNDPWVWCISLSLAAFFLGVFYLCKAQKLVLLLIGFFLASLPVAHFSGTSYGAIFGLLFLFLAFGLARRLVPFKILIIASVLFSAVQYGVGFHKNSGDLWVSTDCLRKDFKSIGQVNDFTMRHSTDLKCGFSQPMRYSGALSKSFSIFSSQCNRRDALDGFDGCNYPLTVFKNYFNKLASLSGNQLELSFGLRENAFFLIYNKVGRDEMKSDRLAVKPSDFGYNHIEFEIQGLKPIQLQSYLNNDKGWSIYADGVLIPNDLDRDQLGVMIPDQVSKIRFQYEFPIALVSYIFLSVVMPFFIIIFLLLPIIGRALRGEVFKA